MARVTPRLEPDHALRLLRVVVDGRVATRAKAEEVGVIPGSALQHIVARAAVQRIVPAVAKQRVVPCPAVHLVPALRAVQSIRVVRAGELEAALRILIDQLLMRERHGAARAVIERNGGEGPQFSRLHGHAIRIRRRALVFLVENVEAEVSSSVVRLVLREFQVVRGEPLVLREIEVIGAFQVRDHIAVAGVDEVIPSPTHQVVGALSGGDDVVAIAAVDHIHTVAAIDRVVARPAVDDIDAGAAKDHVIAVPTLKVVVTVAAVDQVVACAALQGVVAAVAPDPVGDSGPIDDVSIVRAVEVEASREDVGIAHARAVGELDRAQYRRRGRVIGIEVPELDFVLCNRRRGPCRPRRNCPRPRGT